MPLDPRPSHLTGAARAEPSLRDNADGHLMQMVQRVHYLANVAFDQQDRLAAIESRLMGEDPQNGSKGAEVMPQQNCVLSDFESALQRLERALDLISQRANRLSQL
ncbi:MAG: hypothetical protein V4712_17640 [Pseudomonadota bacterium]